MKRKLQKFLVATIVAVVSLCGCGMFGDDAEEAKLSVEQLASRELTATSLKGKILVSNVYTVERTMVFDIYTINATKSTDCDLARSFVVSMDEYNLGFYDQVPYASLNKFFDFADDYTKLSVTKKLEGGDTHAGWINHDGVFMDVNATLGDTARHYSAIGFTNAGEFVYRNDDTEAFYSVDAKSLDNRRVYEYALEDFVPKNQAFLDLKLEGDRVCWSEFSSTDGRRIAFYGMTDGDASTRQIYTAPTLGGELTVFCANPPMSDQLYEIPVADDYAPVYGDSILDWR